MKSHVDLDVWKKSMGLVTEVYRITKHFPDDEMYGLTNQMRRAAVSVPSNIAEGAARGSGKEFIHFLHISLGSLAELETQIFIALNLQYMGNAAGIMQEVTAIRKLAQGLINHLKKR